MTTPAPPPPRQHADPPHLLRGACLSIEYAISLLVDSAVMLTHGRHSSAIVLSVYCLEEIGRARMLIQLCSDCARGGTPPTIDELRRTLERNVSEQPAHLRKLESAYMVRGGSFTLDSTEVAGMSDDEQMAEILRRADEMRRQIDEEQKLGKDAHALRMGANYVNLGADGEWTTPLRLGDVFIDAVNSWSDARHNLHALCYHALHGGWEQACQDLGVEFDWTPAKCVLHVPRFPPADVHTVASWAKQPPTLPPTAPSAPPA